MVKEAEKMCMDKVIVFEQPETWLKLVNDALGDFGSYLTRLKASDLEYSFWDCSGLDDIFQDNELADIFTNIEDALSGYSLQVYHGCRFNSDQNPKVVGLKASSTQGIQTSLLELASKDEVLKEYLSAIREAIDDYFIVQQAKNRDNQVWFCLNRREIINDGGVYCVFGSEYRLLILNNIDELLAQRLLRYGMPAIVVIHLPLDDHLANFRDYTAKYLFALWIHYHMGFSDIDFPGSFSCWIKRDVEPQLIHDVERPERVYDHYNTDSRWYTWEEMYLNEQVN